MAGQRLSREQTAGVMAQVLNDRMMRPEKARGVLNDALARFPDSAVADQMCAYLRHL